MRIESIDIRGFGCLSARRYEFPTGGLALVLEDNERGKSTLAAAFWPRFAGSPSAKPRRDH